MKIFLSLIFIFLSHNILAETIELKCNCFKFQDYNIKYKKFNYKGDCKGGSGILYINVEEKWITPLGDKNIKRNFIIEDEYYYAEFELSEDKDFKKRDRETAIKLNQEVYWGMKYYDKFDRFTLEYSTGVIFGNFTVQEDEFTPLSEVSSIYSCVKPKL